MIYEFGNSNFWMVNIQDLFKHNNMEIFSVNR